MGFFLWDLLRRGLTAEVSWGWIVLPGLLGLATFGATALWERLVLRLPRVPVYAGLAWLAARLIPERDDDASSAAPVDDDVWTRQAAEVLRLRRGFAESRIRQVIGEARATVAAAGHGLQEEFGGPGALAARFRKDKTASVRREAWLLTTVTVGAAVLAVVNLLTGEGRVWITGLWSVLVAALAISRWRTVRRLPTRRGSDPSRVDWRRRAASGSERVAEFRRSHRVRLPVATAGTEGDAGCNCHDDAHQRCPARVEDVEDHKQPHGQRCRDDLGPLGAVVGGRTRPKEAAGQGDARAGDGRAPRSEEADSGSQGGHEPGEYTRARLMREREQGQDDERDHGGTEGAAHGARLRKRDCCAKR